MVPIPKQMAPLRKWSGTYAVKGWMIMMPGAPKTEIAATEVVGTTLGGTVLEFTLKGDPIPQMGSYKGYGAMVWNEQDKCYKSLWVDNMGQGMVTDGYLQGGKLLSGSVRVAMGVHAVACSVITLAADGSPAKISEHTSFNGAAPVQSFHGTYVKK